MGCFCWLVDGWFGLVWLGLRMFACLFRLLVGLLVGWLVDLYARVCFSGFVCYVWFRAAIVSCFLWVCVFVVPLCSTSPPGGTRLTVSAWALAKHWPLAPRFAFACCAN